MSDEVKELVRRLVVGRKRDGRKIFDEGVKAELVANTQSAFDHGAFGSPSFLVGDELYFGKDTLREVEEEIMRQCGKEG